MGHSDASPACVSFVVVSFSFFGLTWFDLSCFRAVPGRLGFGVSELCSRIDLQMFFVFFLQL